MIEYLKIKKVEILGEAVAKINLVGHHKGRALTEVNTGMQTNYMDKGIIQKNIIPETIVA